MVLLSIILYQQERENISTLFTFTFKNENENNPIVAGGTVQGLGENHSHWMCWLELGLGIFTPASHVKWDCCQP